MSRKKSPLPRPRQSQGCVESNRGLMSWKEDYELEKWQRSSNEIGVPQGGVISPLLANKSPKSEKELSLEKIPGIAQAFSFVQPADTEDSPLHLLTRTVSLFEGPDAGKPQVRFCEGPRPTGVWLKYCGTAGKPGGKLRRQTSTCSTGRNRSTRLRPERRRDARKIPKS
jgi:hypothetical protein